MINLLLSFAFAQNIEAVISVNGNKTRLIDRELYIKLLDYNFEITTQNAKLKALILECCYEQMTNDQKKRYENIK